MIVNFDALKRFEKPQITLCNPDSFLDFQGHLTNAVGLLQNHTNLSINYNFNSQSDGTLEYSQITTDNEDENKILSHIFNGIVQDRYLFIENFGFTIITNVIASSDNGLKIKNISFVSCDK